MARGSQSRATRCRSIRPRGKERAIRSLPCVTYNVNIDTFPRTCTRARKVSAKFRSRDTARESFSLPSTEPDFRSTGIVRIAIIIARSLALQHPAQDRPVSRGTSTPLDNSYRRYYEDPRATRRRAAANITRRKDRSARFAIRRVRTRSRGMHDVHARLKRTHVQRTYCNVHVGRPVARSRSLRVRSDVMSDKNRRNDRPAIESCRRDMCVCVCTTRSRSVLPYSMQSVP